MDSSGVVNYVPILLIFVIAAGFAAIMITMSRLAGRNRPTREKLMPYESGVEPVGDARARQSVKFYMVAMLFIIFDIETVFMIPWAAGFRQLPGMTGLLVIEMFIFVLILAVGYAYVWKRGALEWD